MTGSERQIRASMDQDGWIDKYMTELGQRTANLNQRLDRLEEGFDRLNDTVRDVAVENQPSHIDQKLQNRFDEQQVKMEQWAAKVIDQLRKDREADHAKVNRDLAEQMEEHKTAIRKIQEDVDRFHRLEEDIKRSGNKMSKGDELRVALAIQELRREMNQHLSTESRDGRIQALEKPSMGSLHNAINCRLQLVVLTGHQEWGSPFKHHQGPKLLCMILVVWVSGGKNLHAAVTSLMTHRQGHVVRILQHMILWVVSNHDLEYLLSTHQRHQIPY